MKSQMSCLLLDHEKDFNEDENNLIIEKIAPAINLLINMSNSKLEHVSGTVVLQLSFLIWTMRNVDNMEINEISKRTKMSIENVNCMIKDYEIIKRINEKHKEQMVEVNCWLKTILNTLKKK